MISAAGRVFDTATRRTEAGSRPAASAAALMRSLIPARLAEMVILWSLPHGLHGLQHFIQLSHRQADHIGVGTVDRADKMHGTTLNRIRPRLVHRAAGGDIRCDLTFFQLLEGHLRADAPADVDTADLVENREAGDDLVIPAGETGQHPQRVAVIISHLQQPSWPLRQLSFAALHVLPVSCVRLPYPASALSSPSCGLDEA